MACIVFQGPPNKGAGTLEWLVTPEWCGLVAAAARGRKGGRKPVVTPDKLRRAHALIAQGLNVREAAARLKVGKTTLYEALAARAGVAADGRARMGHPRRGSWKREAGSRTGPLKSLRHLAELDFGN